MKDLDAQIRRLRGEGYTVKRARRKNRWHVRDTAGRLVGVLSSTSGDYRNLRNFRADLRRAASR